MTQGELLEADHLDATARELPRGRRPEATEADDDGVDLPRPHCSPSRGSSQRRMSRLASSIGANQPCV